MGKACVDFFNPYRYGRLSSPDSIRLLKIVPELVHQKHIGCVISQHPNSQANAGSVEYRALSYLWGDPTPSRTIGLWDGTDPRAQWHLHQIHSNLWLFLAHMWRKEQFECLLWTDRLCLNQDDKEEMAQQIPRMGLIYSKAERVVIWLGLSAWEEQHLQEYRERLNSQRDYFWHQPQQRRLAMFSVLDHNYWKRVWITQEVAMAKMVVVEMQDIPSFDLEEMGRTIRDFIVRDGGPHMYDLVLMRGPTRMKPMGPKSSWVLLRDHCQRRCTRAQDRIYGLLGMVKEDDPIRQIAVDYKPVTEVLLDTLFTVSNRQLTRDQTFWVIKALVSIGLLEDVNSLEKYSNRDHSWKLTTNEVVKTFASISLKVFDALNLIKATFGGFSISDESRKVVESLVEHIKSLGAPGVDEFQWKVVIGIILTLGLDEFCKRTHEQWKKVRWPKLKAQSLWRCSNHPARESFLRPLAPKPLRVAAVIPLEVTEYKANDILKACAYYSQHGLLCKGSKMILDIDVPEILGNGTRLVLDYAATRYYDVVLNITFQNGASGSA